IFEDALETFNDDISGATSSLPVSIYAPGRTAVEKEIDLTQGLRDGIHIMKLIFENRLNEALTLSKEQYVLTELIEITPQEDMEATIQSLRQTIQLAKKSETYRSWISLTLIGTKQTMGECKSCKLI
ncbi:unnamed protein product, partial [Didymodactylos carnosus]